MAMVMENQQPVAPTMQLVSAPASPPPPPPPLPPHAFKHHCKVCKKGFTCGRALGGHMRAHGVGDDVLSADDDDAVPCGGRGGGGGAGDDSSEAGSASATTTKRMYALRSNPGRQKSCRVCENCGKEFTSWKSLLDHGRCNHEEDGDGDMPGSSRRSPPPLRDDDEDGEEAEDVALAAGWSKGKRTRRTKVMVVGTGAVNEVQVPSPSSEEEDLANCLVMLSSSRTAQQPAVVDVDQESCASASKVNKERHRLLVPQPISMVAPVMPQLKLLAPPQVVPQTVVSTVPRGLFECKACKKVFASHQALGGHRASHKKVKGCFAAKLDSNRGEPPQPVAAIAPQENAKAVADAIVDDPNTASSVDASADGNRANPANAVVVMTATTAPEMAVMQVDEAPAPVAVSPFKKKGKVHECSICHRVFMSGQALGGHKRCHWLTTGAGDPTGAVAKLPFVAQDHVMHAMCQQLTLGRPMFGASDAILDLNVPTNPTAETAAATRQAAELNDGALCLNLPASLYMQSWTAGQSNASNVNRTATSSRNDAAAGGAAAATEDEADSTNAKRVKISDLKDMNVPGETSPWLQVGIVGLPSESRAKSIQE